MINITKLENGNVVIEKDGFIPKGYSNLTDVEIVATTPDSISVISSKRTLILPFEEIDEINGESRPDTIEETVAVLYTSVFSGGGGNGDGVTEEWVEDNFLPLNGTKSMQAPIDMGGYSVNEVSELVGTKSEYDIPVSSDMVTGTVQIDMTTWNNWYGDVAPNSVLRYRDIIKVLGQLTSINSLNDEGELSISGGYNYTQSELQSNLQGYSSTQLNDIWVRGNMFFGNEHRVGGLLDPESLDQAVNLNYFNTTLSGTDKQILGFENGLPKPMLINIKQLTDVGSFPSFANGLFAATAMNSETETGLLIFIEFSTDTPKAGTFPSYGTGGVLPVGNAIANGDAVNKGQIPDILKSIQGYSSSGNQTLSHVNGVLQWITTS